MESIKKIVSVVVLVAVLTLGLASIALAANENTKDFKFTLNPEGKKYSDYYKKPDKDQTCYVTAQSTDHKAKQRVYFGTRKSGSSKQASSVDSALCYSGMKDAKMQLKYKKNMSITKGTSDLTLL